MSTSPAGLAGEVTVICVGPSVMTVPATPPNDTAVGPDRWAPVIVTVCPPAAGPLFGLTLPTVGGGAEGTIAALTFGVSVPVCTTTGLAVPCVAWPLYHCVT